jgi:hypothetical protein
VLTLPFRRTAVLFLVLRPVENFRSKGGRRGATGISQLEADTVPLPTSWYSFKEGARPFDLLPLCRPAVAGCGLHSVICPEKYFLKSTCRILEFLCPKSCDLGVQRTSS